MVFHLMDTLELSEILLSKIDNDNHDQCAEFMIINPVIAKFKVS